MKAAAEELRALRLHPVRRLLHRSLRWPDAGHARHDGQLAVPQRRRHGAAPADPLAADAQGRHRRGHVRQGLAGDDDGAGRHARSALRAGAGRRHVAAQRRRGRGQGADHRGPLRSWAAHPGASGGAGLPGVRLAGRRLPIPGHGGHVAGGGRGPGPGPAALRPRPLGPAHLARHGPPLGAGSRPFNGKKDLPQAHSYPRRTAQRHGGARGLRRLDEPAAAHPRHRLSCRSAPAHGR